MTAELGLLRDAVGVPQFAHINNLAPEGGNSLRGLFYLIYLSRVQPVERN